MSQPSFRKRIWSRIAGLTAVLFVILALLGVTVVPLVFGFQGVNTMSDGLFATGIGGLLLGLVGLGIVPRRVSSVVLSTKRPSITGGTIALSILFAGLLLMLSAALASTLIH